MSHTKQYFILICLTLLSVNITAQSSLRTDYIYAKIDEYLSNGVHQGFSGAVAVVHNGKQIINKGYGLANKTTLSFNDSNTVFDIGSNTKQFTSTAILLLEEQGKLKVEDTLDKFFMNIPTDKQKISIHQLLSHTSGLKDVFGKDFVEISEKEFFESVFKSKLIAQPGQKYHYSNIGYSVLARIIELISGVEYEEFLKKYLFSPSGMKHTGYLLVDWNSTNFSKSYNRGILESESSVLKYQRTNKVSWYLKGNGGINSTQNDMILWMEALKANKIISKAWFKKLTSPYANYPEGKSSYAYGWTVRFLENNLKRLTHNGSNGAYSHSILWYPEKDLYILFATNANSDQVEPIGYRIAKMILDKAYSPKPLKNNMYAFAFDYIQDNPTEKTSELASLLQKEYSNNYSSPRTFNSIGNLLLMLDQNVEWAVALFEFNIKENPSDGNLWDSLGDGYKAAQNKQKSIESYKKAIELGYTGSIVKLKELTEENK